MDKKRKLIDKILCGEKSIESRWYVSRFAPWDRIKKGDTVYFKDAGSPVTVKAFVSEVCQYQNLNDITVMSILKRYGNLIAIEPKNYKAVVEWARKKNYLILIFLNNAAKVKPFRIDKTGFGISCAWICVDNIDKIKLKV